MKITREAEDRARKIVVQLTLVCLGLVLVTMLVIEPLMTIIVIGLLTFIFGSYLVICWLVGAFHFAKVSEEDDEED